MTQQAICRYCGAELTDVAKTSCDWCSKMIQEANCNGIYMGDVMFSIAKQPNLTTPEARRAAIQFKYNDYTRK